MKVYLCTILAILLGSSILFAQNGNTDLFIQSQDGKTVKLLWLLKTWSNDISGFDIKRKEGLQDWVKLNSEPILPGISMKKKLFIVDADRNEVNILKAKLFKLLTTRRLKETDDNTYIQKLTTDNAALKEVNSMMLDDYEIALMNGFAFVDHSVTNKTDYQYGLFIQGTNTLLAKVSWNYGEVPDLNTVREITSRATTSSKGVQLIWNADPGKMKVGNVAGFNVYRQGIRLNSNPVTSTNTADPAEFTWYDKSANSRTPIQYSISAESIFGIEGIIKSYTYDPANHPKEYRKTEVTEVASLGYYFKEGIGVKWIFPKEEERFLKGFIVEKDNMPAGYKKVSGLLDPATRSFNDQTPSSVNEYVRFRVVAVYIDKTEQPGIEKLYSYFPITAPPAPQNFKAKSAWIDKKFVVHLSWDPQIQGDNMTDQYVVYVSDPLNSKFSIATRTQSPKVNSYSYTFQQGGASVYKFCVSSVSRDGTESRISDTIAVQVPTLEMPKPMLGSVVAADSTNASIHWEYPDVSDQKGFRLFANKTMVANENQLKKNMREFNASKLDPGTTYEFTIRAVSDYNIISEFSAPVLVTMPGILKK
jgi:Fibronectin type III domain